MRASMVEDKVSPAPIADNQRLKLGVWDWDLDKNLIYADDAVAGMFGLESKLTENGLAPDQYFSRIHGDDRQLIEDHARLCVETLGVCLDDFRIIRPSGTIWVHSRGRCFADSAKQPTIYAGLIVEIDRPDDNGPLEFFGAPKPNALDDILYLCLHARRICSNLNRPMLNYLLDMAILEIKDDNSQCIDRLKYLI